MFSADPHSPDCTHESHRVFCKFRVLDRSLPSRPRAITHRRRPNFSRPSSTFHRTSAPSNSQSHIVVPHHHPHHGLTALNTALPAAATAPPAPKPLHSIPPPHNQRPLCLQRTPALRRIRAPPRRCRKHETTCHSSAGQVPAAFAQQDAAATQRSRVREDVWAEAERG